MSIADRSGGCAIHTSAGHLYLVDGDAETVAEQLSAARTSEPLAVPSELSSLSRPEAIAQSQFVAGQNRRIEKLETFGRTAKLGSPLDEIVNSK